LSSASPTLRTVIPNWHISGEVWAEHAYRNGTAFTGYGGQTALLAQPIRFDALGVPGNQTGCTASGHIHIWLLWMLLYLVFGAVPNWVGKNVKVQAK
jgi:hypothetical protein